MEIKESITFFNSINAYSPMIQNDQCSLSLIDLNTKKS